MLPTAHIPVYTEDACKIVKCHTVEAKTLILATVLWAMSIYYIDLRDLNNNNEKTKLHSGSIFVFWL